MLKIPLTTEELVKADILNKKDAESGKTFELEVFIKDYSDIRTKLYDFPNRNVTEENAKKGVYRVKDLRLI